MPGLTEQEIFETIHDQFKQAAEECRNIARLNGGYPQLRRHLNLIEGASRQMSVWREDMRWSAIAAIAARAIHDAPKWIRAKQYLKFIKLAQLLENGGKAAHQLLTKATGRKAGAILPSLQPAPHRENKPVSIILPDGYKRAMN